MEQGGHGGVGLPIVRRQRQYAPPGRRRVVRPRQLGRQPRQAPPGLGVLAGLGDGPDVGHCAGLQPLPFQQPRQAGVDLEVIGVGFERLLQGAEGVGAGAAVLEHRRQAAPELHLRRHGLGGRLQVDRGLGLAAGGLQQIGRPFVRLHIAGLRGQDEPPGVQRLFGPAVVAQQPGQPPPGLRIVRPCGVGHDAQGLDRFRSALGLHLDQGLVRFDVLRLDIDDPPPRLDGAPAIAGFAQHPGEPAPVGRVLLVERDQRLQPRRGLGGPALLDQHHSGRFQRLALEIPVEPRGPLIGGHRFVERPGLPVAVGGPKGESGALARAPVNHGHQLCRPRPAIGKDDCGSDLTSDSVSNSLPIINPNKLDKGPPRPPPYPNSNHHSKHHAMPDRRAGSSSPSDDRMNPPRAPRTSSVASAP